MNFYPADVLFGRYKESANREWDVPKNIVIGIDYRPSEDIEVKSTKLNLDSFQVSFESMHNLPLYSYSNNDYGVKYIIDRGADPEGFIQSIEYYPSNKFNYLRCIR